MYLPGEHDVSGALDSVGERLSDAVQVVELGLGDRVVDVDRGHLEVALGEHLGQIVHADEMTYLLDAPLVLLLGLALPGVDGDAGGGDGGRGVVLRGEDVARRPLHGGSELLERLDEHGGLDGHVEASSDAGA
ncbi:hypothetical protein PRIPAC_84519 [Pristionchus pacificus]|uniref:Uncharacterized protein n=1 Tax=Pristionchus pacificus TaxID=54126 RepID=A0A2A6BKL4_PRIPA|nr:hypothetical protein PRIPAC_84519 [Pristionchus pacificus]|eukprot:PDM66331.1 hypothetical protein PRIPAC_47748 [Pristionchus pacificus]